MAAPQVVLGLRVLAQVAQVPERAPGQVRVLAPLVVQQAQPPRALPELPSVQPQLFRP